MRLRDRDDSLKLRPLRRRRPDCGISRKLASFLDEPLHTGRRLNNKRFGRGASSETLNLLYAPVQPSPYQWSVEQNSIGWERLAECYKHGRAEGGWRVF